MGFIQITDTHFVPNDELLYDMSPKQRLAQGVEMINRDHADESFVLITGDLTHYGDEASYRTLKEVLDELTMPYHLVMGNHDSRAPFLNVFPDVPLMDGGFMQFVLEQGNMRILCLDTLNDVPGDHIGMLCDARLRWLADEIAATPADKHLVVVAHHPFFDLGVPNMDDIKLRDAHALLEVFQARKPDLYLFGHVHRPISGVYDGIPFHTQLGFNHQVELCFERKPRLMFTEEQPAIAMVHELAHGLGVFTRSVGGETRFFQSGDENCQSTM